MVYDISTLNPSAQNLQDYDEYEACDSASFRIIIWPLLLILATNYGWEPAGTETPFIYESDEAKLGKWEGGYCSNDGQVVTSDDAAALADALERALMDIPDQPSDVNMEDLLRLKDLKQQGLNVFGGWKPIIVKFIKLCRKGAFYIL